MLPQNQTCAARGRRDQTEALKLRCARSGRRVEAAVELFPKRIALRNQSADRTRERPARVHFEARNNLADEIRRPQAAVGSRIAGWMPTSCFSAVSANLLLVSASRQIPPPNRSPAQFGHHSCQASVGARGAIALWHFKQVEQRLTADALQPIEEVDFAAHAPKREPPRISRLCCSSFHRFFF